MPACARQTTILFGLLALLGGCPGSSDDDVSAADDDTTGVADDDSTSSDDDTSSGDDDTTPGDDDTTAGDDDTTTGLPSIEFTSVPDICTDGDLSGTVLHVDPADVGDYCVAVYLYQGGWWTKPTWAEPTLTVEADGSWTCDITTGGLDAAAWKIAAFLVEAPDCPDVPLAGLPQAEPTLPAWLAQHAVASVEVLRGHTVQFAGREWRVKTSCDGALDPGPIRYSDDPSHLWVDGDGLHLTLGAAGPDAHATEVFLTESLGFGEYQFQIAGPVDETALDPEVVLGLFTYDYFTDAPHRELTLEMSCWGEPGCATDAQYVVQPWDEPGHRERWDLPPTPTSTHVLDWQAAAVTFSSHEGLGTGGPLLHTWTYSDAPSIPDEGTETLHLNLWPTGGVSPHSAHEVVIRDVVFTP